MAAGAGIDWRFETARVSGRLVGDGDIDLYVGLYADATVMRHIAETMSVSDAVAVFDKARKHNANPAVRARYWHLSHQRTGQTLGLAALVRDAAVSTRGELGLMLLPQAQRTGVGLQVLRRVIDGVLLQQWKLGMDEVIARYAPENLDIHRLGEYLGFEKFDVDTPSGSLGWRMTASVWVSGLPEKHQAHTITHSL